MGGFRYALRYPAGGDVDPATLELAVPDIRPGETLTIRAGRQLLVLDVVPLDDPDDDLMRAVLVVEDLTA